MAKAKKKVRKSKAKSPKSGDKDENILQHLSVPVGCPIN